MRPTVIRAQSSTEEFWDLSPSPYAYDSTTPKPVKLTIDNRDARLHNLAVQLLECNKEFAEAFLKLAHQDALEHGPDAVSNVYEHIDLKVLSARTGVSNG